MTTPAERKLAEAESEFAGQWNAAAGRGDGDSDAMLVASAINVASLRIADALHLIALTVERKR